ncbi:hypothetical protein C1646_677053 [Rhizophagus diaphanus]|nr:hypothetical protein C1646_677053 [Rhizophagus diaphanus] [Rhizophagus sp. MUCL 43196]
MESKFNLVANDSFIFFNFGNAVLSVYLEFRLGISVLDLLDAILPQKSYLDVKQNIMVKRINLLYKNSDVVFSRWFKEVTYQVRIPYNEYNTFTMVPWGLFNTRAKLLTY